MSSKKHSTNFLERHKIVTLLTVNLILFLLLELAMNLGLSAYVLKRFNSIESQAPYFSFNPMTHHDYLPFAQFSTHPTAQNSFPSVENTVNSWGIRGPEIDPKKHYRVLNLGDSFVQADEVPLTQHFNSLLNTEFGQKMEFIAHGFSSWAPTVEFAWIYHKGLLLAPDEINLFLCVNDFYRRDVYRAADAQYRQEAIYDGAIPIGFQGARFHRNPNLKKKTFWRQHIKLVDLFCIIADHVKRQQKIGSRHYNHKLPNEIELLARNSSQWPAELKSNVDGTLGVVAELNRYLQQRNIKLNLLMVPLGFAWADETVVGKNHPVYGWDEQFTVGQEGIESYIQNWASQNTIPYIELRASFNAAKAEETQLLFNEQDGHWNKNGHQVVFETLQQYYR